MKKQMVKTVFSCLAGLVLLFSSCSGDSGSDDSVKYDATATADLPTVTDSTIIKNKVVIADSEDVYYEYLKFTSATAGEYSIYKQINDELVKQETVNIQGENTEVPTTFEYDASLGKVKVGSMDTYIIKVGTDYVVASEKLSTSDENKKNLYVEWNSIGNLTKYVFNKDGSVILTDSNSIEYYAQFTNDNGWIIVLPSLSMLYTSGLSENCLYLNAFKTECYEVEEVGRAVCTNVLNFTSSNFIFLK